MTGLGRFPENDPKMAKFGFSANNFGTEGPRDLKFGLLASPGVGLPRTRTISDILDFGPCTTSSSSVSYSLKLMDTLAQVYRSITYQKWVLQKPCPIFTSVLLSLSSGRQVIWFQFE